MKRKLCSLCLHFVLLCDDGFLALTSNKQNIIREYESDLRSNEHYLSSSEKKAWKKSGLYGIWTHDFCDTGEVKVIYFSGLLFTTA